MGTGPSCDHINYTKTYLKTRKGEHLVDYKIYKCSCDDCPHTWKIEVHAGKVTDIPWVKKEIDCDTCPHDKHFTVDVENKLSRKVKSDSGFAIAFFTGGFFDDAQWKSCYVAKCKCDRCD